MARNFNGTSSDTIKGAAAQWPQSAMTLCAHINPTTVSVNQLFASMYEEPGVNQSYCQFGLLNPGQLFCRIQQVRDSTYIGRDSNTSVLTAGSWQHVAMTWDGGTTNAAIKDYLNGVQVDTTNDGSGTFTGPYSGSDLKFNIGLQINGGAPTAVFNGSIAEVVLYNVALTPTEIIALASGARPSSIRPQSIFRWYPLDGYQHPALDRSIWKSHGVLTGTSFTPGPPLLNPAPILLPLPNPTVVMPPMPMPPPPQFILMPQIVM